MKKKQTYRILAVSILSTIILVGCTNSSASSTPVGNSASVPTSANSASQASTSVRESPASPVTELVVRFGDEGAPFYMNLEQNSTASTIAGYVGTADWRLPIYNYDESEVMQYYTIPSRYEIPDGSELVTHAQAGDVFYSNPNRIVLYYHDAEIQEEYTKIGTFEATDSFVSAVEDNPVREGWTNKLVLISETE